MISRDTACFLACAILAMTSCAPKATVVEEAVVPKVEQKKELKPLEPLEPIAPLPDDGLRMGDIFQMPGDNDFRATNPTAVRPAGEAGAVISRPPTEPPSRVKPKTEGGE